MKKLILFAAILFAGVSVVRAQNTTGSVKLNVNLQAIQTITVLSEQKVVDLNYVTEDNYTKGVILSQGDHLKVSSTGGFFVTVSSKDNKLTRTGTGGGEISGETITVTPSKGFTNSLTTAEYLPAKLNNGGSIHIIESSTGGFGHYFNIEYKGGTDYINKYIANDGISVYTTDVLYTLTAK